MLDLVSKLAGAFLLDHDPRVDQLGEDRTNFFERPTRERRQIAERNRPAHHRDQLEQALRRGIQAAQLRGHAIGQALGQAAEMRSRQIAPFGQERTQQPDREQRVALRALAHPVDERARRGPFDHRLGQLSHRAARQCADRETG